MSPLVLGDMLALLPESDALGDAPLVEPAPAILPVFDVSALLDGFGVPGVLDDAGGVVDALVSGLVLLAGVLGGGVEEAAEGGALPEAPAFDAMLASLDGVVVVVVVVVVVDEFCGAIAVVAGAVLLASLFSSLLQPATMAIATALAAINTLRFSIVGSCMGGERRDTVFLDAAHGSTSIRDHVTSVQKRLQTLCRDLRMSTR